MLSRERYGIGVLGPLLDRSRDSMLSLSLDSEQLA